MKIAIISDLHGNINALNNVLKDINQEKCDKIFCLGDLVLFGKAPKETLDKLKNISNLEIIQGNTDKIVIKEQFINPPIKEVEEAIEDARAKLTEEDFEYLRALPAQKELEIEGIKILLVHGSPRKNDENIYPNLKIEEVEDIIKDTDADVIFCGHTHLPCGYQTNTKKTVVNVGSIGRPFTENPQGCYVVANIRNGDIEFMHKFIDI